MEQLIEFVTGNMWLVIAAVVFLLSLFRKAKGEETQKGGMPDFGGNGSAPGRQGGSPVPKQQGGPAPAPRPRQQPVHGSPRPQAKQAVHTDSQHSERDRQQPGASRQQPASSATKSFQAANVNSGERPAALRSPASGEAGAEEIRNAILWAEVLGPPRAKKPYRRPYQ